MVEIPFTLGVQKRLIEVPHQGSGRVQDHSVGCLDNGIIPVQKYKSKSLTVRQKLGKGRQVTLVLTDLIILSVEVRIRQGSGKWASFLRQGTQLIYSLETGEIKTKKGVIS